MRPDIAHFFKNSCSDIYAEITNKVCFNTLTRWDATTLVSLATVHRRMHGERIGLPYDFSVEHPAYKARGKQEVDWG